MKNRIIKIMGVVLTLAVLIGLLVPAATVSAGDLKWTNVDMPVTKDFRITDNTDLSAFAVAPDGKTMFAYDTENEQLFKSTDGGLTWDNEDMGEDLGTDITKLVVSPEFADDDVVVAMNGTTVYITYNAGETWDDLDPVDELGWASDTAITDVDVAYDYKGRLSVLIASDSGIGVYTEKSGTRWLDMDNGEMESTDVLAAAFSPEFDLDGMVIAITATTSDTYVEFGWVPDLLTTATVEWNWDFSGALVLDDAGAFSGDKAYIAFPDDYGYGSSSNKFFVAVVDTTVGDEQEEIFRVYQSGSAMRDVEISDPSGITALAFNGTASSGTLVAGTSNGEIHRTTEANQSDPEWDSSDDSASPKGAVAAMAFVDETLYVATSGTGSAIYVSEDLDSFAAVSLIALGDLTGLAIDGGNYKTAGDTQFVTLSSKYLFKSEDAGASWKLVYTENHGSNYAIKGVTLSRNYADDSTIWLTLNQRYILESTDGGATWEEINVRYTEGRAIEAATIADADNYWVAAKGEIFKNNERTGVELDDVPADGFGALLRVNPTWFLVTTKGGPLYFSDDDGATFEKLGDETWAASTQDVGGKTVYAVAKDSAKTLYKWVIGTSDEWEEVDTLDEVNGTVKKIAYVAGGVLYVAAAQTDDDVEQLYRCVNLTAPAGKQTFAAVPGTKIDDNGTYSNFAVAAGENGNTITATFNLDDVDKDNGYASKMMSYTDILVAGPTVIAPVANAQTGTNVTFQWNPVESTKTIKYKAQLSTDPKFNGLVEINGDTTYITESTQAFVDGLRPNQTYYFRVAVAGAGSDDDLGSQWSETVKFTVQLGLSDNNDIAGPNGNSLSPAPGAMDVGVRPAFQWAAVTGAQQYEIQVADNAAFQNPLASAKVDNTVFMVDKDLDNGKTYFWRVRAVAGEVVSPWVAGTFTVAPKAAVVPPEETKPAQTFFDPQSGRYFNTQEELEAYQAAQKAAEGNVPVQSTPAYIWVIIAIGAVLVIAVIVLIARTRRV